MAELRFERMTIPGARLGAPGEYPIMYKQKMFEKGSLLGEDEGLYINYANINHVLPYTSLDDYDHTLEERSFETAVLENDRLKAVFVPALGGRMWSLYDKAEKRDLIVNNPVFRPRNFALRNAWFSGGVEWNCGVRGHAAHTCDALYAAETQLPGGEPVLRLYAFERIRGVTYQMDFFLKDDLPFLFARMRIKNGTDRVVPIYWWSTIAVKEEEGARVVVPADQAYVNKAEDPVYLEDIPMVDGVDLTYPTNHPIALDHFYKIPEGSRKYEAYVDKNGAGVIHASTRRLKGRKLFVWGTGTGGKNWQHALTSGKGWEQPYLEIQAGLAPTQNESLPMPPGTAWEWVEAYGAVNLDPKAVHGDWQRSKKTVQGWLDEALPEAVLDELLAASKPMAAAPATRRLDGHPWGALDNALRERMGQKPASPHLDFGDMGPEQALWMRFLQGGYLDEPDPANAPASYMVQPEWFELLQQAVEGADAGNWHAWYHLGLGYFARDMYRQAEEAFAKSARLRPSTWACHALANTARVLGRPEESAALMAKALDMNPDSLPLAKETLRFAYEAKVWSLMEAVLKRLPKAMLEEGMVQMYRAFMLAHTGRLIEAKSILERGGGLAVYDLREGDDSLPDEYIWIEQQLAKMRGVTLACEDVKVPKGIDFRMFHSSK